MKSRRAPIRGGGACCSGVRREQDGPSERLTRLTVEGGGDVTNMSPV